MNVNVSEHLSYSFIFDRFLRCSWFQAQQQIDAVETSWSPRRTAKLSSGGGGAGRATNPFISRASFGLAFRFVLYDCLAI